MSPDSSTMRMLRFLDIIEQVHYDRDVREQELYLTNITGC